MVEEMHIILVLNPEMVRKMAETRNCCVDWGFPVHCTWWEGSVSIVAQGFQGDQKDWCHWLGLSSMSELSILLCTIEDPSFCFGFQEFVFFCAVCLCFEAAVFNAYMDSDIPGTAIF